MSAEIVPFRIEVQTDGELRVSDVDLADHLGYGDVKSFRRLVRDHLGNLNKINQVRSEHLASKQGGGRQGRAFWFTEAQALYIISRSDKPIASDLMVEVSVAFIEMRRNQPVTRDLLRLNILSPEVRIWEKRFEKPFFVNLHRVLGLAKTGRNNHPNCGHFINRYVYDFLFGEIGLEVIREANPKILRANDNGAAEYQRAFRHHQMLRPEHDKVFNQHIRTLNTLLGIANSIGHFDDIFNATFPKSCTQIGFAFNEQRLGLSAAQGARP